METLAYLQIAQDFEDPENKELVFLKDGLAMFKSVSGLRLPSQTLFILLGVASSAFAWNLASSAQAIVLQQGDSGSDVSYLQNLLNQGGYSVPVTGYYGSQTTAQVTSFQADSKLTEDGVAGNSTFAALEGGFLPIQPGTSGGLRQGSSGSDVTEVQDLLYKKGYFNGTSTGYFGSVTTDAVIAFQYDSNLSADGVVGSATLAALRGNGGLLPISPSPSSSTLSYGSSGPAVRTVQTLLTNKGYLVSVDGSFGATTEQKVKDFQYDNYLLNDGVVGSATLAALNAERPILPGTSNPGSGYSYIYGDSGSKVVAIQQFLKKGGYYSGALDGIYGSATSNAVASYQKAKGITADGIWGPQTAGA